MAAMGFCRSGWKSIHTREYIPRGGFADNPVGAFQRSLHFIEIDLLKSWLA